MSLLCLNSSETKHWTRQCLPRPIRIVFVLHLDRVKVIYRREGSAEEKHISAVFGDAYLVWWLCLPLPGRLYHCIHGSSPSTTGLLWCMRCANHTRCSKSRLRILFGKRSCRKTTMPECIANRVNDKVARCQRLNQRYSFNWLGDRQGRSRNLLRTLSQEKRARLTSFVAWYPTLNTRILDTEMIWTIRFCFDSSALPRNEFVESSWTAISTLVSSEQSCVFEVDVVVGSTVGQRDRRDEMFAGRVRVKLIKTNKVLIEFSRLYDWENRAISNYVNNRCRNLWKELLDIKRAGTLKNPMWIEFPLWTRTGLNRVDLVLWLEQIKSVTV